MRRSVFIVIVTTVFTAATGVAVLSTSHNEPVIGDMSSTANIEALTQGEIIVKYDEDCSYGGKEVCVPNYYTILWDQIVYK